ncbi:MAG: glycosyltransferase [Bacilli bacterium]|jgi:glycosyltransferase involved in cell wall biosynthesis
MNNKICFVIQSLDVGGSSKVVFDILSQLAPNKNLDLFLIVFFNSIDERYVSLLRDERIHAYILNKKQIIDRDFEIQLKKVVQDISPDIISSHLTCTFYLNKFLDYDKTHLFHTIHNKPQADLPFIYRLFLRKNIQSGKIKLIGCSKKVAEESQAFYGVPVQSIQNGIDARQILKKDIALAKYDFLCIGRMTKIKRFEDCVKAFYLVYKNNNNLKLCLCGYGKTKKRVLRLISHLGLNNNIDVYGADMDVGELYQNSKCFVLFSSREGAPIVILEAMSYGLPIIASDVNGVSDFVKEGVNGYLFKCKDLYAASNFMEKIIHDESISNRLSLNSLDLIKNFSAERMAQQYLRAFIDAKDQK